MRYHFLLPLLGLMLHRELFTQLPLRQKVRILRVLDGDTLEMSGGERVRLAGVDAPELSQGRPGELASRCLRRLLKGAAWELTPKGRDIYGRVLGEFWRGGESLNVRLLEEGCASIYPLETTPELWRAREQAKRRRVGLWSEGGFLRPQYFRRTKKSKATAVAFEKRGGKELRLKGEPQTRSH